MVRLHVLLVTLRLVLGPLLLWLPFLQLVGYGLAGIAGAALLGTRLPTDAQAALAPLIGIAVMVCASPLLLVGVDPELIGALVVLAGILAAAYRRRSVGRIVRGMAVPAAVVVGVIALVSAPWIAHGGWNAASYGNPDPYLWVSEARAFLDGPAPAPSTEYPDRDAYELVDSMEMPIGLTLGVSLSAVLSGQSPESAASAFFVLLSGLLAGSAYFLGRGVLRWRPAMAALGAAAVGVHPYLLFSSQYGWHGLLLLTTFGLAAAFAFRLALERAASWRERVLTGIFAAAGVATYGASFGLFALMIAAVLVAYLLSTRPPRPEWQRIVRVVGGCALAALVVGAVPIARAVLSLDAFEVAANGIHEHPRALPSEALGLAPRLASIDRAPSVWQVGALVLTVVLIVLMAFQQRRASYRCKDALTGAGAFILVAEVIALLPWTHSYASMKVVGYGSSVLILLAVGTLFVTRVRGRAARLVVATGVVFFVGASSLAAVQPIVGLRYADELAGVRTSVAGLPPRAPVAIAVEEAWSQAWVVYFLRDRPTRIVRPSVFFTGFGTRPRPRSTVDGAYLVVEEDDGQAAVWEGDGLVARRLAGAGPGSV